MATIHHHTTTISFPKSHFLSHLTVYGRANSCISKVEQKNIEADPVAWMKELHVIRPEVKPLESDWEKILGGPAKGLATSNALWEKLILNHGAPTRCPVSSLQYLTFTNLHCHKPPHETRYIFTEQDLFHQNVKILTKSAEHGCSNTAGACRGAATGHATLFKF